MEILKHANVVNFYIRCNVVILYALYFTDQQCIERTF